MELRNRSQDIQYTFQPGEAPTLTHGREQHTLYPTDLEISFSYGIVLTNGDPYKVSARVTGKVFCEEYQICQCDRFAMRNWRYETLVYHTLSEMPEWVQDIAQPLMPDWWVK